MIHRITIELNAEDFAPIAEAARHEGKSPERFIADHITAFTPSAERRRQSIERIKRLAAESDFVSGGVDNESIDRDLADEYGSSQSDAA